MRQVMRLIMRGQPKLLARLMEYPVIRGQTAARRGRKIFTDVVERNRIRFQSTVKESRSLVQNILHFQSYNLKHVATAVGVDGDNSHSYFQCNDNRNSIRNESISLTQKEKKTDALNVKNSLTQRKQRLQEAFLLRREMINKAIQMSTSNVEGKLMVKKKKLEEAMNARKVVLNEAEQRFVARSRLIIQDIKDTKDLVKEKMEQVVEKENIYTIPNLLCVTRIVFSPYLGYLIVSENYEYALGFMVVAGVTDWLDGWIARNHKSQSTKIGSFLDPMADKVLIGTLFLTLTYVGLIPVALTALIVARDVALVVAGFVIRYQSLPPPRTLVRYFDATHATAQLAPTLTSKINTGVQLAFVGSTLAAPVFDYVGHPALDALCYVTATSTILAAASYIISKDTYRYLSRKR